jgi:hypothetical protein
LLRRAKRAAPPGNPAVPLRFLEPHSQECALLRHSAARAKRVALATAAGLLERSFVGTKNLKVFVAHASSDGSFTDM